MVVYAVRFDAVSPIKSLRSTIAHHIIHDFQSVQAMQARAGDGRHSRVPSSLPHRRR